METHVPTAERCLYCLIKKIMLKTYVLFSSSRVCCIDVKCQVSLECLLRGSVLQCVAVSSVIRMCILFLSPCAQRAHHSIDVYIHTAENRSGSCLSIRISCSLSTTPSLSLPLSLLPLPPAPRFFTVFLSLYIALYLMLLRRSYRQFRIRSIFENASKSKVKTIIGLLSLISMVVFHCRSDNPKKKSKFSKMGPHGLKVRHKT